MLPFTRAFMLERSQASDAAFDGKFLTGVTSTGIYCLPSCRARKPNPENVVFVADVAAAEKLGLRPCLRCRPDDFVAGRDRGQDLVAELLAKLRRDPASVRTVSAWVELSGVGATQFHELCRRHLHLSPAEVLQRERVAAARRRLLCSDEKVADVAFAVGFESLSTFNHNVRELTGLSASALRLLRAKTSFVLELPADFRMAETLAILGRDPASRSERRRGDSVAKALWLDGRPACVEIELVAGAGKEPPRARVQVQGEGPFSAMAMAEAHDATLRLLGLPSDTRGFAARARLAAGSPAPTEADEPCRGVARVSELVARRPGLRVPRMPSMFETVTWAVLGQQVNLSFALTLRRALVELAGAAVPGTDLLVPPSPAAVALLLPADLAARQLSRRKAEVLIGLASSVAGGDFDLEALAFGTATAAHDRLLAVRGLGPWSAGYVAMRGAGFVDAVPVGDSALATALGRCFGLDPRPRGEELRTLLAPFAPYRSLATMHLWLSLGDSP